MKINLENFQDIERDEAFDWAPHRRRPRQKKSWPKIIIAILLALLIILLIGYFSLKFFIGPIVKTVDGLPSDFPTALTFYQADQAQINLASPIGQAKMIAGLQAMPDWILDIFFNFLSDDLKNKLADNFGENINIDKNFSADDLKEALDNIDLDKTQTVNLSWKNLDKTKEEMAAYYKQKLQAANFDFKENLNDYQINLGFWQNDIFGLMSFSDKKEKIEGGVKYGSQADITVNYLNKLSD